jgi:hypothetical protein
MLLAWKQGSLAGSFKQQAAHEDVESEETEAETFRL